jgi:hypothetical protein
MNLCPAALVLHTAALSWLPCGLTCGKGLCLFSARLVYRADWLPTTGATHAHEVRNEGHGAGCRIRDALATPH